MAENTSKRSIWAFQGLPGMLIAVALLLGILVFLTAGVISTTCDSATKPYDASLIREITNLKANGDMDAQKKFAFQAPKSETK